MEDCIEFKPAEKLIYISDEPISVFSMYSAWKQWAKRNPQYEPALRAVGGPNNLPTVFFLINGWQIDIPAGKTIRLVGSLYNDKKGRSVMHGGDDAVTMIA